MLKRSLFALIGAMVCTAALAQSSIKLAYQGATFTIASSTRAPWAAADDKPDAVEIKRLTGKKIVFQRDQVVAPTPLACAKPHYKTQAYTTDLLFEGGLTKPNEQAAALGFKGDAIPTLIPGCEIEFHFVDADHALFGLNNSVYRIVRSTTN